MKIVVAPDSFKGSMDAFGVANAIKLGIQAVFPGAEIVLCPLADGGEGSGEIWARYLGAKKVRATVKDPLGRNIESHYYYNNDSRTAIIESSLAAGLTLLSPSERNPSMTSTYGVGQLIDNAIFVGAEQIYLTLGGSATNDMGIGMASALGYEFSDQNPYLLATIGENLAAINYLSISKSAHNRIGKVKFYGLCDVSNRLYGTQGAATIYGKQKGADTEMIQMLDAGMRHLDQICIKYDHYNLSNINISKLEGVKGAGAAGGFGYGAMYFLGAELISGIEALLDLVGFDEMIQDADFIITGEGMIDVQTAYGKTISGIINIAKMVNVPVYAVCGQCRLDFNQLNGLGLQKVVALSLNNEVINASFEKTGEMIEIATKAMIT